VNKLLPIPGVAEYAHGFRGIAEAVYLRDHITRQIELAGTTADPAERAARCTFVVVGAGYTGTEVVAQGQLLTTRLARTVPGLARQPIRWLLLDTAPRLLPELDPRLSRTAERVLGRRGVEVRTGQSVAEALDDSVQLSTGEKVATRSLIWCVGVRADPLVDGFVTGVRGTTNGDVILTGSQANADGTTKPFLYEGPLTSAANEVSALTPPFPGFQTGTFYGPDTSTYNPDTIPAGQVRAVGSYRTKPTRGVLNHGMIYLGPVSGQGGSWTTIDVPPDGSNTVDSVRACPPAPPGCFVMDTIAHSTMGDLVVGNYDLNLGHGVSGNAFIYNMTTRQWTLLQLGGSLSSQTTLYGIWQNGGPGSPNYTLAGGSSAHGSSPRGNQRAFLMNYNERTGRFGKPRFYTYGNAPALVTHFDGITAVPGGFNLVAVSSAQASSMAFVPATGGDWPRFGTATWYPIDVAASSLCSAGCNIVTGNTVYQNQVMGLYVQQSDGKARTYLATVATP
jgi:parallel beta-helix repeat protein